MIGEDPHPYSMKIHKLTLELLSQFVPPNR